MGCGRRLLDVAQPPEAIQPVERQGGLNAECQLVLALVRPSQIGILYVRVDISAGELSIAVHLESKPGRELLAVGPVVGEIDATEPEPLLAFDGRRIVAADLILMPLVVPVVVAEHQPAQLARWEFGLALLLSLR